MKIDTRFLSPHSATMLWWDQREQCERCEHVRLKQGQGGEAIMRCAASSQQNVAVRAMHWARGMEHQYCIDARLPDGVCGPDASKFKPASCSACRGLGYDSSGQRCGCQD